MLASESRNDSNNVGPYLVVILLARTIGYNLFIPKELRLTEVHDVASSNRFARSITRPISLLRSLRDATGKCVCAVAKQS